MAHYCSECGKPIAENASFCTNCGASLTGKAPAKAQWQAKRERVLGIQGNAGRRKKILAVIFGAAIFGTWLFSNLPESGNPVIKSSPVVTNAISYGAMGQQMATIGTRVDNGKIILPLSVVKEKKFVKFAYGDSQFGLPLLAYISSEGKIITAISVCEPCNSTDFHIKGDNIICNSCGSTWKLNTLEAVSGSCGKYPPDAVPNAVVGNEIQIDEETVARWQRRI